MPVPPSNAAFSRELDNEGLAGLVEGRAARLTALW
jgi:hypothetical protein